MANNIELERNAHCRAKKVKNQIKKWSIFEKVCLVIERERNPPCSGKGGGSCGNFEQHQQNLAPATPLFAILCVRTRKRVSAGACALLSHLCISVSMCVCMYVSKFFI